jgi:hypothetical protein
MANRIADPGFEASIGGARITPGSSGTLTRIQSGLSGAWALRWLHALDTRTDVQLTGNVAVTAGETLHLGLTIGVLDPRGNQFNWNWGLEWRNNNGLNYMGTNESNPGLPAFTTVGERRITRLNMVVPALVTSCAVFINAFSDPAIGSVEVLLDDLYLGDSAAEAAVDPRMARASLSGVAPERIP